MTPKEIQEWAARVKQNPHKHGTAEYTFAAECIRLRAELDERKRETTMERGTRIHRELLESWKQPLIPLPAIPLQVHDEVMFEAPTQLAAFRCETYGCPERPPVHAATAPKCYTCDRRMAKVADVGPNITELVEKIQRRMFESMAVPAGLLGPGTLPNSAEPKLLEREWGDDLVKEFAEYKPYKDHPPERASRLWDDLRMRPGERLTDPPGPRQIPREPKGKWGPSVISRAIREAGYARQLQDLQRDLLYGRAEHGTRAYVERTLLCTEGVQAVTLNEVPSKPGHIAVVVYVPENLENTKRLAIEVALRNAVAVGITYDLDFVSSHT